MKFKTLYLTVALSISTIALGDEMSFPELLDVGIAGTPKLAPPILLKTTEDMPILTEKHGLAAPALWDWDQDGDLDLLVGEFETNSEDFPSGAEGSTIRVYENVGTNQAPEYDPNFSWARDTEGTILEVPQWCCIGFTPYFYDLNDDGYQDMITGQYHPGEVTWFRGSESGFMPGEKLPQEGDPSSNWLPFHARGEDVVKPDIETFNYWVYSSAAMGDFDDDGDFDLVVGGNALRISENIGGRKRPSFAKRELLLDIHGQPLKVRERTETELSYVSEDSPAPTSGDEKVSPYVVDWDEDGVLDLMVTDSYRAGVSKAVAFFRGVKTSEGHRFEPSVDLLPAADGAKALPGSGQRVYVADWNGDGVNDLLIGASVATVNGGEFSDELSWEWEAVNKVESAGKDPGLYPPRPKPTVENTLARYEEMGFESPLSPEELEENVKMQAEYWEKDIGRLYREGKEHWLTMRHQGRVYVLLGSRRSAETAVIPAETIDATPASVFASTESTTTKETSSGYPVQIAFSGPDTIGVGEQADLIIDFDMDSEWYIYAPTGRNAKEDMVETNVSLSFPEGIEKQGGFKLPAYQYKGLFDVYFGKDVQWKQAFQVNSDTSPGAYELCGDVTVQTCKDDLCLAPKTDTYCASVVVQN